MCADWQKAQHWLTLVYYYYYYYYYYYVVLS
jgi:hypothetical protein